MYENLKGKKLLVLGSEEMEVNIVKAAQSMGIYVVAADGKKKSTSTFAKNVADESWDVDYSDTKLMVKKCRESGIDGVMAGYSEFRVLAAARISKELGTPFYATEEQIELTRNKEIFKKECSKYQVPVPKEYVISCDNGNVTLKDVHFPVIVKPTDYGGRKGITICYTKEELEGAISYALSLSQSKTIVVEDYIDGIEYAAIYSLSDGEISLSCFNEKYLNKEVSKSGLCDLAMTPSSYIDTYVKTTDKNIREFLKGIGAKNGVAFFQGIVADDICYVFEMGYRLNGGNDYFLIEQNNNISYMKMLISYSLTGSMGDNLGKDNPYFKRYCCNFIRYGHGGMVKKAAFCGDVNHEGIDEIHICAVPGMVIKDDGTTAQRAFSFKISSETKEGIVALIDYIQDNLILEDDNGKNILFQPFDTSRIK